MKDGAIANTAGTQQSSDSDTSSLHDTLSQITNALQHAISGQDRDTAAQVLISSLQHLPVSPDQRRIPSAAGPQLLQLGAQAMKLAAGHAQVAARHSCQKFMVDYCSTC